MKIGKYTASDIYKIALFDTAKIKFIAVWFMASLMISVFVGYLLSFLSFSKETADLIDVGGSLLAALVGLIPVIGVVVLIGQDLKKTKKQKKFKLLLAIKNLYLKAIGVILVYLLTLLPIPLVLVLLGFLSRIPQVGYILVALAAVPAVTVLVFYLVYLLVGGKLLIISLIDAPKQSVRQVVKDIIGLIKTKCVRITLNFFFSLLIILPVLLALVLLFGVAYILYLMLSWQLPGNEYVLRLSLVSGQNLISFIIAVSTSFLLAIMGAYLVSLTQTIYYSIYLDAKAAK